MLRACKVLASVEMSGLRPGLYSGPVTPSPPPVTSQNEAAAGQQGRQRLEEWLKRLQESPVGQPAMPAAAATPLASPPARPQPLPPAAGAAYQPPSVAAAVPQPLLAAATKGQPLPSSLAAAAGSSAARPSPFVQPAAPSPPPQAPTTSAVSSVPAPTSSCPGAAMPEQTSSRGAAPRPYPSPCPQQPLQQPPQQQPQPPASFPSELPSRATAPAGYPSYGQPQPQWQQPAQPAQMPAAWPAGGGMTSASSWPQPAATSHPPCVGGASYMSMAPLAPQPGKCKKCKIVVFRLNSAALSSGTSREVALCIRGCCVPAHISSPLCRNELGLTLPQHT